MRQVDHLSLTLQVRESLAFFKQTCKLLKKKRYIVDVCGGHGLLGAL